jgi:XTP/dITP diphosphohydrolase
LSELGESENRKARFISIITYKNNEREDVFEGNMEGCIAMNPRGENGFGYDPIFIPDGYTKTNAELSPEEKNAISHRRKALDELVRYLRR